MDQKILFKLVGFGALLLPISGCATYHPLTLHFNGHTVEVEDLKNASFPRGLEIQSFNGKFMKLSGKETIWINGKDLSVKGSTVNYGNFSGRLGNKQKLVVQRNNGFRIEEQDAAKNKASWWKFWR